MNSEIQFLLYNLPDEEGRVQVIIRDETIWCTQKAMAQLFGVGVPAISKHLKNIFQEGELQKEVVVSKMEITTRHGAMEGKTQISSVDFYHLDAIIAVGYRVNIENQIERHNTFTMEQFAASVNKFLTFNDYQILPDKGRISALQAKARAESEYDMFNKTQRIDSDFDKQVREMLGEK